MDATKNVNIIEKRSWLRTRPIDQKLRETQRFRCEVPAPLAV